MSELLKVIKNKNKIEKQIRAKHKDEMNKLRLQTQFKAKLNEELKHIDVLLEDSNIDSVVITIQSTMQPLFETALYSGELDYYSIEQVKGTANQFYIKKKFISF